MQMPHNPKRGSLGFSPRKRAKSSYPKLRANFSDNKKRILGFSAYKAGNTHVMMLDDRPNVASSNEGISKVVTVLDTPPMNVLAIRLYKFEKRRKEIVAEAWTKNISEDLSRKLTLPKDFEHKENLEKIEKIIKEDGEFQIRVLVSTQPRFAKIKKKPDVMEYSVGGEIVEDQLDYAKEKLGKEISIKDVFSEGEYIDVSSITKGKGRQGFVKRWGIMIQNRKTRQSKRHVGCVGPWTPHEIMWSVPNTGQMGYHQRTEYNKRILKTGSEGIEITPKGGFLGYGIIRGEYALVLGSIPGARKRVIRLRPALRSKYPMSKPNISYISLKSKQGA